MILIVDDNINFIGWMAEVIEQSGYYCDTACNAYVAKYKLSRINYALAIIDMTLIGGQNGLEIVSYVKTLAKPFSDTPLVIMTGGLLEMSEPDLRFLEVLRKPFYPRDLRSLIERRASPPIKDLFHVNRMQQVIKQEPKDD